MYLASYTSMCKFLLQRRAQASLRRCCSTQPLCRLRCLSVGLAVESTAAARPRSRSPRLPEPRPKSAPPTPVRALHFTNPDIVELADLVDAEVNVIMDRSDAEVGVIMDRIDPIEQKLEVLITSRIQLTTRCETCEQKLDSVLRQLGVSREGRAGGRLQNLEEYVQALEHIPPRPKCAAPSFRVAGGIPVTPASAIGGGRPEAGARPRDEGWLVSPTSSSDSDLNDGGRINNELRVLLSRVKALEKELQAMNEGLRLFASPSET